MSNINVTPGTGATVVTDTVGGAEYQKIKLDIGATGVSSPFTGTIPELTNIVGGTVTKVQGGTINNLATGTVVVGGGTTNVTTGSIVVTSGTTNITAGTMVQASGTLTTGTLQNLVSGTVTIGNGTVVASAGSIVVTAGTTNINTGTIVQASGTLTTGTLQNLVSGTINAGSVVLKSTGGNNAFIDANGALAANLLDANGNSIDDGAGNLDIRLVKNGYRPINKATSFGTLGTAGGSQFGTISAVSGAGTVHIVSGIDIVATSGTPEVLVLYGSALSGGSVLAQGAFAPGGGISNSFSTPVESGTNSEIIYHFVNAGTARITVKYWKTV